MRASSKGVVLAVSIIFAFFFFMYSLFFYLFLSFRYCSISMRASSSALSGSSCNNTLEASMYSRESYFLELPSLSGSRVRTMNMALLTLGASWYSFS